MAFEKIKAIETYLNTQRYNDNSARLSIKKMTDMVKWLYHNALGITDINTDMIAKYTDFIDKSGISVVYDTLPYEIPTIGDGAFYKMSSMFYSQVEMPDWITSINQRAFYNCNGLPFTDLPPDITSIADHAFDKARPLPFTYIPNKVKYIGEYAFAESNGYFSALPNSIINIGKKAFSGCTVMDNNGKSALPSNIEYLADYSLSNMGLGAIDSLPVQITYLPEGIFCKSGVTSINTTNIKTIGEYAFDYAFALTKIEIPNVTAILSYAFRDCKNLVLTTLPDNIHYIGDYAFKNDPSVNLSKYPDNLQYLGNYACDNISTITTIPSGLIYIGDGTFSGCVNLTATTLPSNVEYIGAYTFYNCVKLALTSLPDTIISIGPGAFYDCGGLKISNLPKYIRRIERNTFHQCYQINIKTIPKYVDFIGDQAFYNCEEMTSLKFDGTPSYISASAFEGCSNIKTITVPWASGSVANAPWGATNATITYNS